MSSDASPPVPPDAPGPVARDRRQFLRILGLGLSTGLGAPGLAFAQASGTPAAKPGEPPKPAAPPPAPPATPPAAEGPPPLSEDARSLAEIVRRRYGRHLTPDQLEAVTRELDQRVQSGRRLRDAKLSNGDEPDFTFRVEP